MRIATNNPFTNWIIVTRFGIAFLVVIASFLTIYFIGRKVISMAERVSEHESTIVALQSGLSHIRDAETNQRGFLLSEDRVFLDAYTRSVEKIPAAIKTIESHEPGGPESSPIVERLKALVDQRVAQFELTVGLGRENRFNEAITIGRADPNRKICMDSIISSFDKLIELETQARTEAIEDVTFSSNIRTAVFVVLGILNICVIYYAAVGLAKSVQISQKQQEMFAAWLRHLGE